MIDQEAWEWLKQVHTDQLPDAHEVLLNRIEAEQRIIEHHEACREQMLRGDPPIGWSNEGVASYAMAMHWCVSCIVEGWRHHPGFDPEWLAEYDKEVS